MDGVGTMTLQSLLGLLSVSWNFEGSAGAGPISDCTVAQVTDVRVEIFDASNHSVYDGLHACAEIGRAHV